MLDYTGEYHIIIIIIIIIWIVEVDWWWEWNPDAWDRLGIVVGVGDLNWDPEMVAANIRNEGIDFGMNEMK